MKDWFMPLNLHNQYSQMQMIWEMREEERITLN